MTYILIAILLIKDSGHASVVTQEFNTAQACMIASAEIRRQVESTGRIGLPVLTCLPKGDKK